MSFGGALALRTTFRLNCPPKTGAQRHHGRGSAPGGSPRGTRWFESSGTTVWRCCALRHPHPPTGGPGGVHLDAPGQRRGQLPSSVWTRHGAVRQGHSRGSVGTTSRGKGRGRRGQAKGEGGHWGGERRMGAAACGGRGFKGRVRDCGGRPVGAARCRQRHNPASCQPLPHPSTGGASRGCRVPRVLLNNSASQGGGGTGRLGLTHTEAGYGRPVDRGAWTAKTVKRPRQQPAHPQYANYWAPLTRKRHIPPRPAQPWHTKPLGSANAETTPARAPAAAADRTQRPDTTCEGKNG